MTHGCVGGHCEQLTAALEALAAKAKAATPGPWRLQVIDFCGADGTTVKIGGTVQGAWDDNDPDPQFIAAMNPEVAAALVAVSLAVRETVREGKPNDFPALLAALEKATGVT